MSGLFKHHFLVAMPELAQSNLGKPYADALCYICEHTEKGAMGLIVNQALPETLGSLYTTMGIDDGRHRIDPLFYGGPIEAQQGFVLHRATGRTWQASLPISESLSLTTSPDILEALSQGKGPEEFMVVLGFMGWEPGQLEDELSDNLWLSIPADESILFDTVPEFRTHAAMKALGIEFSLFPDQKAS